MLNDSTDKFGLSTEALYDQSNHIMISLPRAPSNGVKLLSCTFVFVCMQKVSPKTSEVCARLIQRPAGDGADVRFAIQRPWRSCSGQGRFSDNICAPTLLSNYSIYNRAVNDLPIVSGSATLQFNCDLCGVQMLKRACKVTCPHCGYRFECSDLTLNFEEKTSPQNSSTPIKAHAHSA